MFARVSIVAAFFVLAFDASAKTYSYRMNEAIVVDYKSNSEWALFELLQDEIVTLIKQDRNHTQLGHFRDKALLDNDLNLIMGTDDKGDCRAYSATISRNKNNDRGYGEILEFGVISDKGNIYIITDYWGGCPSAQEGAVTTYKLRSLIEHRYGRMTVHNETGEITFEDAGAFE